MLFLGLHELFVLMSHFLYVSIGNYKAPEGVLCHHAYYTLIH